MEVEMEARVKPVPYKIRAMSRESPTQKASHVLDPDLRTHWSTATNTKEWILLELEETSLLSHIRIHNKSVLEWEIAVGLRYKPETFVKVRPRCEAPRRDMLYPMNYTPCRFVRISCLRGNPIAIFFVQLIGISVPGLEQEFQPVIDYLLPHIISHKHDAHDIYLQLLNDLTSRLSPFVSHLETDLTTFPENMETNIRFLSMLVGPFYPILAVVSERESSKAASGMLEADQNRSSQSSLLTISSNFQVQSRKVRGLNYSQHTPTSLLVFRPDAVLLLLRKAFKDSHLGNLCKTVSRLLKRLSAPGRSELFSANVETATTNGTEDYLLKAEPVFQTQLTDYSELFGEEFKVVEEETSDIPTANVIDIAAVEEALLHILFACASQPAICRRLSDPKSDLLSAVPFIQAMLPALRPEGVNNSNCEQVDEAFLQWQAPLVQNALTQIAAISSSTTYRPLLDALSSYLSSYSPSQAKAACVLIDLCSGPVAPWIHMVIAKVDLTIELLEDFLGILQNPQYGNTNVRAALFCIILALSGHMDNVLPKFKEVKHRLLFVIEMLEPFLMPAITTIKNTIAFGEVSAVFLERQECACAQALEFVRTAVQKPAVLPSLEKEWRKGHVTPSVLLSILAPHVPLPPGIDFQKTAKIKHPEHESSSTLSVSSEQQSASLSKSNAIYEDGDGKPEVMDGISKNGISEDGSQLFAPADIKNMSLRSFSAPYERNPPDLLPLGQKTLKSGANASTDSTHMKKMKEDAALSDESRDLQTEYLQLVNFQARELKASEFIHFAEELHARADVDIESHDASVDALMLAAECHLNPYFMGDSCLENESKKIASKSSEVLNANSMSDVLFPSKKMPAVNVVSNLEDKRDRNVINILLQAAEWQNGILSVTQYDKQNDEKSLVCDIDDHENEFKLFSTDPDSMDAVTLLRQHQRILCNFLMRQLQREQHNMYEVLLHGLLFYLRSATKIYSSPESIVDIILQAAERLNKVLLSLYYQRKDMSSSIENDKLFGIRRQWKLLQRVIYSAAGNEIDDETHDYWKRGYHYRNLVPVSSWVSMIPFFSFSSYPLVRYVGWMALATFARDHRDRGVLMVQDINLMAGLLTVFKDELASVKNLRFKESRENQTHFQSDQSSSKNGNAVHKNDSEGDLEYGGFVNALHPELEMFFPNIRNQFNKNAEVILDIVCFHLKSIPPSYIPDVLVWFSEFCANPCTFRDSSKKSNTDSHDDLRGHVASNLKFIILRILEVIILEHMDIIVPEIPKLIQLLHSLCKSSYCDVALLESVLTILKPLITYTVSKLATSDCILHENSSAMSFEHLCFNSLISELKSGPANNDISGENGSQGALLIYLTGCLLTDISIAQRKEVLQSLLQWASFSCFDSTVAYYDYLCAFQKVFDALNFLVQDSLEDLGVLSKNEFSSVIRESASFGNCGNCSALQFGSEKGEQDTLEWEINSQEDSCIQEDSLLNMRDSMRSENENFNYENKDVENSRLKNFFSVADIEEFMKVLKSIVFGLSQTLELCLKFHPQMTSELSKAITNCLLYAGALVPAYRLFRTNDKDSNNETSLYISDAEKISSIWSVSLETVSDSSLAFAKSHCWQVSAAMIECLLQLPLSFNLNSITRSLFSFFEYFCFNAPKISFRLQVSKWLSKLFERETKFFSNSEFMPLIEFFCKMLDHPEPEQRFIAMQQLGKIVELEELGKLKGSDMRKSGEEDNVAATVKNLSQSGLVCTLVSHTWDRVASLATSELSTNMRNEALKLLYNFVPYSERHHIQSVFHSIDSLLPAVVSFTVLEGQFTCLVLSLLARACLYSDFEDIDILPQSLWDNVELLAISKKGHILLQLESSLCKALLQLKDQTDNAKEELEEALINHPDDKCSDASLADVRESILQVLARMKSLRSKFDEVEKSCNQEVKELEELEIELELMQEEERIQGFSSSGNKPPKVKSVSSKTPTINVHKRLEEIREDIRKHEISEVRKEIAARRERDRMARHTRQRNLQEAALHELELIQELDRERIADAEREIERQRSLERERAKTREMRYNLEMEVEKRNQREIQRELEQREAGLRPSRREFATTSSSRPRERYRERDGRPCQDGVLRPSSSGGVIREGSGTPPPTPNAAASASSVINIGPVSSTPTIITNSSRAFLGQPSTLLQNRERFDDRSYEDAFDPMRDNGDTGSVGDPELGSTIDMMNMGGYGASNRQISRSGKPRQIIERRERETRREGKWERKQG